MDCDSQEKHLHGKVQMVAVSSGQVIHDVSKV